MNLSECGDEASLERNRSRRSSFQQALKGMPCSLEIDWSLSLSDCSEIMLLTEFWVSRAAGLQFSIKFQLDAAGSSLCRRAHGYDLVQLIEIFLETL